MQQKKKQIVELVMNEPKNWHNQSNPTIQFKLWILEVNKTNKSKILIIIINYYLKYHINSIFSNTFFVE